MRSAHRLAEIAAHNPFLKLGVDKDVLHIMFLSGTPPARRIAALDQERSPGDAFEVRDSEIYLHLPSGVARCKLTNANVNATLATTSTSRSWRTVLRLLAMAERA